jgi:Flp pilus assembly protein TadG
MRKLRESENGVAVVEFTIALPVLLTLFLATCEIGRAFLQYNALTRAARDSARFVAAWAERGQAGTINLDATLVANARNLLVYGNIAGTGTPLLAGLAPGMVTVRDAGGNHVAVSVTYPYQPMIAPSPPDLVRGGNIFTGLLNLRAEVVMRAL